ncbi:MAG TPA: YebC/PmpR family DNA-binding transcriptional regulator [Candidatus Absconditabacterales bacterium]|nr:YebC/PmpR family DNA-binding transcriptional regulator [Candidatus Absconditabacterales bacterium]
MGRRHSIAARKASGDAKKSQVYAKVGKIIQIAARKGADAKMNPALELALSKAKQYNLPREVVEKAILKGSGQLEGENLEEIFYEGYGPEGVALLIKALTPNTNRSAANVKQIMYKYGGVLGAIGSVAWQFKEQGVIVIDGTSETIQDKGKTLEKVLALNIEELEERAMELPIADFEVDEHTVVIYVDKTNFSIVQKALEKFNYHMIEADIQFIPENMVKLDQENTNKLYALLDALDDDEDVDHVWHNMGN